MADPSVPIDPDRILEHPFTAVRRGYDPLEVQRYLLQVANQLRAGREREAELRHQLDEEQDRKAPIDDLDPARLTRLLGEETARVLEAAQTAAADIRAKAEENVARLLREARDEAQQMRDDAESVLGRKTAEAEEAAAKVRADADRELEAARSESAELVEAGRQEGRAMVGEAQKVRQRMLDDLSRRRKQLRQQIEQLQAGRERLMAAYDVVRETLDVATDELQVALPEAKLAAESASSHDDDVDFEAELEAAQSAAAAVDDVEAEPPAGAGAPEADASEPDQPGDGPEPEEAASGDATSEAEGAEVEEPDPSATDGTDDSPTATSEADDGGDTDEPSDAALGADEGEVGARDDESLAPDPVEGRHSSSVRVVKGKGEKDDTGDKAADVFARLRGADGDDDVETPGASAPTDVPESAASPAADDDAGLPAAEAVPEPNAPEASDTEAGPEGEEELEGPARLVAQRDLAIADLERNLARRLKRELSDEQNELLSSLAEAKGTPTAEEVLPDPADHLGRIEAVALPTLAAAATAGAELLAVVGGRSSAANGSVADLAGQLAADVVGPLRDRLERAFDGGDADEVAQRIRSSYREWKGQRVDTLASHAVVAACNRGLLEHLPEGTLVHWVVAAGDAPSPDCEDNALAGAVKVGDEFPTGHVVPPLHAACRCIVVPADS